MADVAEETAYYLNSKIPALALIAKGVRFPDGAWIRVADPTVLPWRVEDLLRNMLPALKGTAVTFATLLTEFDVKEFEAGRYGPPWRGAQLARR
jgi:hypothetical protein